MPLTHLACWTSQSAGLRWPRTAGKVAGPNPPSRSRGTPRVAYRILCRERDGHMPAAGVLAPTAVGSSGPTLLARGRDVTVTGSPVSLRCGQARESRGWAPRRGRWLLSGHSVLRVLSRRQQVKRIVKSIHHESGSFLKSASPRSFT